MINSHNVLLLFEQKPAEFPSSISSYKYISGEGYLLLLLFGSAYGWELESISCENWNR